MGMNMSEKILARHAGLDSVEPGQPIIINDYSALESRVATNTKALSRELRQFSDRMAREMKRQKFNAYLAQRI